MSSQHTNRQWAVIAVAFAVLAVVTIFTMLYEVRVTREDIQTTLETQPQSLTIQAEVGVHKVRLHPQDDEASCGLTAYAVIQATRATYDAHGNLTGGYFTRQSGLSTCEGEFWLAIDQLVGQLSTPFKRA